jgi:hypothetical protein
MWTEIFFRYESAGDVTSSLGVDRETEAAKDRDDLRA